MLKLILFDIDGVLIRIPKRYSSVLKDLGYAKAPEALDKYYTSDLECVTGKRDPLKEIEKYLDEFGWTAGPESFFNEQFNFESQYLDNDLIKSIQLLRENGIPCFLATDQNHYRKEYLLNRLKLKEKFDGWFVSSEIGFRKADNEYWNNIILKITRIYNNTKNNEILFIDDRIENIKIAKKYGFRTFYIQNECSINELLVILSKEIEKRRNRTIAST